jgi:hypothetical protein
VDKIDIPVPSAVTWTFDNGGVRGSGDDEWEGDVEVVLADSVVTIIVGKDRVRLAQGAVGTQIAKAIHYALTEGAPR